MYTLKCNTQLMRMPSRQLCRHLMSETGDGGNIELSLGVYSSSQIQMACFRKRLLDVEAGGKCCFLLAKALGTSGDVVLTTLQDVAKCGGGEITYLAHRTWKPQDQFQLQQHISRMDLILTRKHFIDCRQE